MRHCYYSEVNICAHVPCHDPDRLLRARTRNFGPLSRENIASWVLDFRCSRFLLLRLLLLQATSFSFCHVLHCRLVFPGGHDGDRTVARKTATRTLLQNQWDLIGARASADRASMRENRPNEDRQLPFPSPTRIEVNVLCGAKSSLVWVPSRGSSSMRFREIT